MNFLRKLLNLVRSLFGKKESKIGEKQSKIKPDLMGYPTDRTSKNFKQADELNSEGWDCHEKRQYSAALQYYDQAIALCPDFPMIWNNKGLAHFRLRDFELAKEAYLRAIEISPNFIKPFSNLGILHLELGNDKKEAARWFRKALALDPNYQRAKEYLALCEIQGLDVTVSSFHVKKK